VEAIARGAALMSRTELTSVRIDADAHEKLPNRTLSEVIHQNLEQIGAPQFSAQEKDFARQTQASLERKLDKALSETVEPLLKEPGQGLGSTDLGDISWFVPVGNLRVASYTFGAPGHSWQIVACTGTSIGEKGLMVAAKVLATSAIDLYLSPQLRERVKADFQKIRDPLEYHTLIPEGQKAPKVVR
jgi:aminobenzoyl-glutamate utilization protein B